MVKKIIARETDTPTDADIVLDTAMADHITDENMLDLNSMSTQPSY